jgi:hypothetical protein
VTTRPKDKDFVATPRLEKVAILHHPNSPPAVRRVDYFSALTLSFLGLLHRASAIQLDIMKSHMPSGDHGASNLTDFHPSVSIVESLRSEAVVDEEESSLSIPTHPLGIKPAGNAYTATENARSKTSCFQILPDEVLAILLEYLDSTELRMLGATCKAFYAFCRADDLWKTLFIEYVLFHF